MSRRSDLCRFYPYKSKRELDARKRLADRAVQKAIRDGKLVRQGCERCTRKRDVEAHHDDYDQPLQVRWFCRFHHRQRDAEVRAAVRLGQPTNLPADVLRRIEHQTKRKHALTTIAAEAIVRKATVLLSDAMDADRVSDSALARRLGVSRANVGMQFAAGFRTLALFAKYADALGYEASVVLTRRKSDDEAVA